MYAACNIALVRVRGVAQAERLRATSSKAWPKSRLSKRTIVVNWRFSAHGRSGPTSIGPAWRCPRKTRGRGATNPARSAPHRPAEGQGPAGRRDYILGQSRPQLYYYTASEQPYEVSRNSSQWKKVFQSIGSPGPSPSLCASLLMDASVSLSSEAVSPASVPRATSSPSASSP